MSDTSIWHFILDKMCVRLSQVYNDYLPTVMLRLDCDSLPLTYILLDPGITVTVQVYMSADVACSEEISSLIVYIPAKVVMVVLLPPGPLRIPVSSTSLSTTSGSSRMIQVRARWSPG